jgi:hypothetical protein
MRTQRELAWAAGLYEGEGSVSMVRRRKPEQAKRHGMASCRVRLDMTDEDTVRRFHAAVGIGRVYGPYSPPSAGPNRKPVWCWGVDGFEKAQAIAALLWFGLGSRRKSQFRAALDSARTLYTTRDPRTGRYVSHATLGELG